jgi:hypothetical protein
MGARVHWARSSAVSPTFIVRCRCTLPESAIGRLADKGIWRKAGTDEPDSSQQFWVESDSTDAALRTVEEALKAAGSHCICDEAVPVTMR